MNRIIKTISVLLIFSVLVGAAYAQFSKPEDAIKYRKAVIRAAEMCTVKRTLTHPPEIHVTTNGEL